MSPTQHVVPACGWQTDEGANFLGLGIVATAYRTSIRAMLPMLIRSHYDAIVSELGAKAFPLRVVVEHLRDASASATA